jgi:Na+-translocating ferredoxin:NAD+ oxidoreductase RnfG subunit
MGKFFIPCYRKITLLLVLFSLALQPAFAQIISLSRSEIKAQTRKSQKEAALYQADHKETHLEVQNFNHKKGESGRKQVRVLEEPAEYVSDKEINAIYEEPRQEAPRSRTRKSKKENK